MARSLPAGPTSGALRAAVASGAEVVDGLRTHAGRVVACEAAARAVADRRRRMEILGTADALVTAMEKAVTALDDLLAAASEVVGTVSAVRPDGLALLTERAEALRGYAAGLRELTA
jgi:hypothetical protein